MRLLDHGCCEPLKAVMHGMLASLAVLCLAYNVCAWGQRRQRHLWRNALVYGALIAFEARKIYGHCGRQAVSALECVACRRQ